MKRIAMGLVLAWCVCALADADADLRAAHERERAGQKAEAVAGYAGVYANDKLPKHQRLAALKAAFIVRSHSDPFFFSGERRAAEGVSPYERVSRLLGARRYALGAIPRLLKTEI